MVHHGGATWLCIFSPTSGKQTLKLYWCKNHTPTGMDVLAQDVTLLAERAQARGCGGKEGRHPCRATKEDPQSHCHWIWLAETVDPACLAATLSSAQSTQLQQCAAKTCRRRWAVHRFLKHMLNSCLQDFCWDFCW